MRRKEHLFGIAVGVALLAVLLARDPTAGVQPVPRLCLRHGRAVAAAGILVVSASAGFASPSRAGPIRRVEGIGDAALFTPAANRDFHQVTGPAGAAPMLQVRVGDLILRFLAGRSDGSGNRAYRAYPLPALRQLAAAALTARAWS